MFNNCNQDRPNLCPSNCYIVGPTGPTGPAGPGGSATITVGETITGEPGTEAIVTNVGTSENVILEFTIPEGVPGETPTFAIGSVTTGAPGSEAEVTITEA